MQRIARGRTNVEGVMKIEAFPDHAALAEGTAMVLSEALAGPATHSMVVTGGTTPGPTYDRLSRRNLDWARITVTLSDERWVDPGRLRATKVSFADAF